MPRFGTWTPELAGRLAAIVGEAGLRTDDAARERYGRDETEALRFTPDAVALPASTAEVAAVLRLATEARLPVTPRGAGTGLSGGALPVHGGLVLGLERMHRILAIDAAALTAEVEAGVVTADLHAAVEACGLFYPPDPASAESCLIGGNLAEDAAGPRSCKYGTTRHWVLGLEAVLADGRVLVTGGRNRKDVTGYNLTQLLIGSEGTLAVITRAVLRLTTRPAATLTAALAFPTLEAAARAVVAIFQAGLAPAACEIVEARGLELVAELEPVPAALRAAGAALLLGFDGADRDALLAAAARLEAVAGEAASCELLVATDERDQRRLWRARSRVGEAVKRRSSYKEVDAVVPRPALAELVLAARAAARRQGLEAVCYGHAGDGNLHVNLLRGELDEAAWSRRRDAAEDELLAAVLELGGAVSGEHGIGWSQRRHLPRALGATVLDLHRRLKQAFDPLGILNPGKVLPD